MSIVSKIKYPIKDEMKLFEKKFKQSLQSKVPLLDRIMHYIIKRKGKQMRPMFVFLTAQLFGEVNDNILAKNTFPLNMLRFKLSFFGASRYDPKSDRWLRVSFFAGAPFYEELNSQNVEDWGFATMNSYQ